MRLPAPIANESVKSVPFYNKGNNELRAFVRDEIWIAEKQYRGCETLASDRKRKYCWTEKGNMIVC